MTKCEKVRGTHLESSVNAYNVFISGIEGDRSLLLVQDEAVRVSPWREDGRGVRQTLGHPVF